jgi:hypothetical protein
MNFLEAIKIIHISKGRMYRGNEIGSEVSVFFSPFHEERDIVCVVRTETFTKKSYLTSDDILAIDWKTRE